MSVACVILNYNDALTAIALIKYIRDFKALDYIVVVDNNSTDNSWEELQSYKNEKISLVRTEKNGGYGFGNNVGINYSVEILNADYVLIANPDVVFEEECIEKLVEVLQQNTDVAVVSAKQSNSIHWAWKNCNIIQHVLATSLFFEIWLSIREYSKSYFLNKKEVPVFAVPGSLLLVDAKKMIQYGMYDEEIFLYYEELVLAQKFADHGLKTILRLDTSYAHEHHVSISKTYRRWSQQHRVLLKSGELFLRKYKHANALQMALAKVWFAYTRVELAIYDLYRKIRP
ncbi:MAG TPA: glycosyltransferase family 2 protein [Edaphocola sp.]|nr:glycosyltransferase family 2 protein [Edaphocola sp.]